MNANMKELTNNIVVFPFTYIIDIMGESTKPVVINHNIEPSLL